MAVTNQQIQFEYIADGSTTIFPFSCRVILASDLIVSVAGIVVNGYNVEGLNADTGGNIIFDVAPGVGSKVLILRSIPLSRETDYQTNGDFLAKTVNKDFDRIWMALQNASGWFKRALSYPVGGKNYDAENRRIENLSDPVSNTDASNKRYVDSKLQSNESTLAKTIEAKNQACECKTLASEYSDDARISAQQSEISKSGAEEAQTAAEEAQKKMKTAIDDLMLMKQGPPGKDGKDGSEVALSSSVTSNSETTAATSKAVKTINDALTKISNNVETIGSETRVYNQDKTTYVFIRNDGVTALYNSKSRKATWYFDENGNLLEGAVPASRVTGMTSYMVSSYRSNDGNSYFRKYSDGWVEQGGRLNASQQTITFLVPFINDDSIYNVDVTPVVNTGGTNNQYAPRVQWFNMRQMGTWVNAAAGFWSAEGYFA